MLFEQVSTRRRQCTFWTQGRLQGCKARLSVGLEGLLGGTHRQHPEGWGCFPGTWASLLPEAPCQAEDAWSGGPGGGEAEGCQGFEGPTGCGRALCSCRGKSWDPRGGGLALGAGHFPAPERRGFGCPDRGWGCGRAGGLRGPLGGRPCSSLCFLRSRALGKRPACLST